MINKGVLQDDKSYVYTCHACGFKNAECPYCYGKDWGRCRVEIRTAKGQRYYALLKTILTCLGRDIYLKAKEIGDQQDKLAIVDVGYISLYFDLNFKATCEWLEETGAIRASATEQILASKHKVKDIYAAAHTKYAALKSDGDE